MLTEKTINTCIDSLYLLCRSGGGEEYKEAYEEMLRYKTNKINVKFHSLKEEVDDFSLTLNA